MTILDNTNNKPLKENDEKHQRYIRQRQIQKQQYAVIFLRTIREYNSFVFNK